MRSSADRRQLWPVGLVLVAGLSFILLMLALRQGPPTDATAEPMRAVRVLELEPLALTVEARGFGSVTPARRWQAVANVAGHVTYRHPRLLDGHILPAGTRVLEIDPSRYELAVAAARADLAALDTELAQLQQEQQNTRDLLALERRRLTLSDRELARAQRLAEQGVLAANLLDEQQRANLQQRQAVQGLENTLRLMPSRLEHLAARRDRAATSLAQAERDLADTRFDAPYDLRVGAVDVEPHQHVNPGQTLFVGDGIERAEALVQIPLPALRLLLAQIPATGTADRDDWPDIGALVNLDALSARLQLAGSPDVTWHARVLRMASGIDPDTRTVQVVLGVDEPYRRAQPPRHPPLVRGMYVEAVLSARAPEPRLVIPRSALHAGEVYLADPTDRLQRRLVEVAYTQRDLAVIRSGLEAGDRVILDDLSPAIEGMKLDVTVDTAAAERLAATALGEGP
ncbi:MAG: efflux transporter periplasmic adaptor subunit [Gammaproteobacteria bacterium]|nr:efflux transporter periplasmic adaptor subunit [Gammaproteobacteria bacterium]MDX5375175.1 efflux transporter periplasmic adaptor subunit [Gammaproteobacteria bacterium]